MQKKTLFTFIFIILTTYIAVGQKKSAVTVKDFKNLTGCWQGTLNYSGTIIRKPYSTTAQLVVKQIGKTSAFELLHIYTKDPNDNVADTITVSTNGRKLNQQTIKLKRQAAGGNLEIVTEALGFDHDNNKEATIKQIYTIGKNSYSYTKQVRLVGQTDWLDRQEFRYERLVCESKK